jgi:peptidoglycan/xylan/chitin deacetylase (PgdA/CDA1 family)
VAVPLPPLCLTYHGVDEVSLLMDPYRLFVRPKDLRRHIRALQRWGYRFTTFSELAAEVSSGHGAGLVALTFDDGLADNVEILAPILEEAGVPGTVFVVSGWLGRSYPHALWKRMLEPAELNELIDAGVEIGSHTRCHPDLTRLPDAEALAEMCRGKEELEDVIGRPVEVFAYPYGHADRRVAGLCRDAGFRAACMTEGQGSWDDRFRLPRQAVTNGMTLAGLWLRRHDRYESLKEATDPWLGTPPGRATMRIVRELRTLVR